jgi:hypothetical protein
MLSEGQLLVPVELPAERFRTSLHSRNNGTLLVAEFFLASARRPLFLRKCGAGSYTTPQSIEITPCGRRTGVVIRREEEVPGSHSLDRESNLESNLGGLKANVLWPAYRSMLDGRVRSAVTTPVNLT